MWVHLVEWRPGEQWELATHRVLRYGELGFCCMRRKTKLKISVRLQARKYS